MNVEYIATDKTKCCGCSACAAACPVGAIEMRLDKYGFFYPVISQDKCVNCSLCVKSCCEANHIEKNLPLNTYAASYKNHAASTKSSSGGIFPAIANQILSEGGIVYGTAFDEMYSANVIRVETSDDLHRIQGSKYVQSRMEGIYKKIEDDLEAQNTVLFSGVPCQAAALRQYLRKSYDNLIVVDVVCHGTPSNQMFTDYIRFLQEKKNIKITEFIFRDKTYGQNITGSISFEKDGKSNKKKLKSYDSSYYKLFLKLAILRESCYQCKFAEPKRVGDITVCDYWGIDRVHPDFVDSVRNEGLSGISAMMINTNCGKEMFDRIKSQLVFIPSEYQYVRKDNPQLNEPAQLTGERDLVMKLYSDNGYSAVDEYYHKHYRLKIITSKVGLILPESIKRRLLEMKRKLLK